MKRSNIVPISGLASRPRLQYTPYTLVIGLERPDSVTFYEGDFRSILLKIITEMFQSDEDKYYNEAYMFRDFLLDYNQRYPNQQILWDQDLEIAFNNNKDPELTLERVGAFKLDQLQDDMVMENFLDGIFSQSEMLELFIQWKFQNQPTEEMRNMIENYHMSGFVNNDFKRWTISIRNVKSGDTLYINE